MFQKFSRFSKLCFSFIILGIIQESDAHPSSIESARQSMNCRHIAKILERHYQIPDGLLQAIGTVESRLKAWVVCEGRRGIHFSSKGEAETYLKKILGSGCSEDIFVGCMQLSYRNHRKRFKTCADLLNPFQNLNYAAKMIVRFYRQFGNWEKAIRCYHHSRESASSRRYAQKVLAAWRKINPLFAQKNIAYRIDNGKTVYYLKQMASS